MFDAQKFGDTTFQWTKALSNKWMEVKKYHRRSLSLISTLKLQDLYFMNSEQ